MDYPAKLRVRNSIEQSSIILLLQKAVTEGRSQEYIDYIVQALNSKVAEILTTKEQAHVRRLGLI